MCSSNMFPSKKEFTNWVWSLNNLVSRKGVDPAHNDNLLCKIKCFIGFSATNKIDNLTCVIIHDNLTCVDYYETH